MSPINVCGKVLKQISNFLVTDRCQQRIMAEKSWSRTSQYVALQKGATPTTRIRTTTGPFEFIVHRRAVPPSDHTKRIASDAIEWAHRTVGSLTTVHIEPVRTPKITPWVAGGKRAHRTGHRFPETVPKCLRDSTRASRGVGRVPLVRPRQQRLQDQLGMAPCDKERRGP